MLWLFSVRIGRWGLRIFFILLLGVVALFAYLHHVGVPAVFTDLFLERMAREGYHLQIHRLRLEIDRGLVAQGVRMFARADVPAPFLEAEELAVSADPGALWKHHRFTPVLAVTRGTLRARPGGLRFGVRSGTGEVEIREIDLRFSANSNELMLRAFSADCLGIHFTGRGAIYFAPDGRNEADTPSAAEASATTSPVAINPLARALDALQEAPDGVMRAVEQLNDLRFHAPPTAEFSFVVYLAHPESNTASLHFRNPAGGEVRGLTFDAVDASLSWAQGVLRFPDIQIHKGDGLAALSGWFQTRENLIRAQLVNTLPPADFLDAFPPPVREAVVAVIPNPHFPLRLEWETGPVPVERALEDFQAHLTLSDAVIRSVPIQKLDLSLERHAGEWAIPAATLQLSNGPYATRLAISNGSFLPPTRRFQVQIDGAVNPHHFKPLLTTNMQTIVDWFGVQEPVVCNVTVGGVVGNPAVYCFGPARATNFTVRGIPIQSLKAQLNITNEVMHMTGLVLHRPEGTARGDVHMAFSNQTLRLDVESTVDARATANMIGPAVSNFCVPFHMDGPVRIQLSGLLDYCNFSLNRLQGHLTAADFGYSRWVTESVDTDFAVRGRRILFSNTTAKAYGGQLAGSARLYPVARDDRWRYEVQLSKLEEIRLNDLLEASIGKPVPTLSGDLSGFGQISGMIGRNEGPTVTGTGHLTIQNGHLFQSRLFTGLSDILSKVLPDFSLFAQTDATGDIAIRNSRIHSRDIRLKGTVFSIKASGSYGFDFTLNYLVEVQLLRGGPVAALLRLATLPVTRLLEFRLTGTLANPAWRPANLNPADLFN